MRYDFTVIGGGIVGLSTGMALAKRFPAAKILLLEKEKHWSAHQTGRNSGVIHSGIYYKPGSHKAEFSRRGRQALVEFCGEHGLRHELCGKLIVATVECELPRLEKLFERGLQHGLSVSKLNAREAAEIEPHVSCLAAIRVPETGIVDYRQVSEKIAEVLVQKGAELRLETEVRGVERRSESYRLETARETFETRALINCAGLQSDRVARLAGAKPAARIVPFRGEYYELRPGKRHLAKHLIYPVPNPDFPFLGVHFTRMIDGTVHAGPNAVLALKREGYGWTEFSLRDFTETMIFPGFWKLALRNMGEGSKEMWRSLSKKAFVRNLQSLIPEVTDADVVTSQSGVRAQALLPDGQLVDDFLIEKDVNAVHVLNAPSPAATCSIEIGRAIAEMLPG
ncbi:MAG: hydroxyglutarate oxidase [Bdellovibrionales bacterium RIFOXYC1_FULL_54_43]|nr:MAG: hydroxyglutarate oxidase [Bdellovibrionales bacterium RIFOXYC1_FULL_54_43]OFZ83978.1 MAG: hydroxyglutarate oxidase [Bdellovibrionales bacterium RIFOXYD1_FULL_55_31]